MLGCFSRLKRPSTIVPPSTKPSFHGGRNTCVPSASVFKSFNSVFEPSDFEKPSSSYSQNLAAEAELISSAMASCRLFPASPGPSNSIFDSPSAIIRLGSTGVAVPTYSPDPYLDFRRSMEEMAAAIGVSGRASHLDLSVLRELLFCYLQLNRQQAHKYIVKAFADLLISLSTDADDKAFHRE